MGRLDGVSLEDLHAQLAEGEFIADLHESPEQFGYDRQAWFPLLVDHYLKDEFDVEYSLVHIRRMMREAGLSWRTARSRHSDGDPEKEAEFREPVEKSRRPD